MVNEFRKTRPRFFGLSLRGLIMTKTALFRLAGCLGKTDAQYAPLRITDAHDQTPRTAAATNQTPRAARFSLSIGMGGPNK